MYDCGPTLFEILAGAYFLGAIGFTIHALGTRRYTVGESFAYGFKWPWKLIANDWK